MFVFSTKSTENSTILRKNRKKQKGYGRTRCVCAPFCACPSGSGRIKPPLCSFAPQLRSTVRRVRLRSYRQTARCKVRQITTLMRPISSGHLVRETLAQVLRCVPAPRRMGAPLCSRQSAKQAFAQTIAPPLCCLGFCWLAGALSLCPRWTANPVRHNMPHGSGYNCVLYDAASRMRSTACGGGVLDTVDDKDNTNCEGTSRKRRTFLVYPIDFLWDELYNNVEVILWMG